MDNRTSHPFSWLRRTKSQPTRTQQPQTIINEPQPAPASNVEPEHTVDTPEILSLLEPAAQAQLESPTQHSQYPAAGVDGSHPLHIEYRWVPSQDLHYFMAHTQTTYQPSTAPVNLPDDQNLEDHEHDAADTFTAHIEHELAAQGIDDALLAHSMPDGKLEVIAQITSSTLHAITQPQQDHPALDQLIPCVVLDLAPTETQAFVSALRIRYPSSDGISDGIPNSYQGIPSSRKLHPHRTVRQSTRTKRQQSSANNSTAPQDDADSEESSSTDRKNHRQPTESEAHLYSEDAILDAAMAYFRSQGFPFRRLSPFVSMQRINKLARTPTERLLNATTGLDVADTYHPHRFYVHGANSPSLYDAFNDDTLLRRALRLRLQDNGRLTDDFPTTLNLVTHSTAGSNFRPGFAMYLYQHYCRPGSVVLDCCTGFGGRLVGFLASGIADPKAPPQQTGRYIGFDPNTQTHAGNVRLASELGFAANVDLFNLPIEDALEQIDQLHMEARCDFALTSPPYFSKEHYSNEPTQSDVRYPTPQAWRSGFLRPLLQFTARALKPGAYALINIDDVQLRSIFVPLLDWTHEAAIDAGLDYIEHITYRLRSQSDTSGNSTRVEREPVLVFRKPLLAEPPTTSGVPTTEHTTARHQPGSSTQPATLQKPVAAAASARAATATLSLQPTVSPVARASALQYDTSSLLYWMTRLYARTADERTVVGRMGVWPVELAPYIIGLCRCHSTEKYGGPPELTFAPDLLRWDTYHKKPVRPRTCLLLFSGGKDSLAAGMLAERAGYRVVAVTITKINRSFPYEPIHARAMAQLMGWEHRLLRPNRLPIGILGQSVIKNQFSLAYALSMLEYIPEAYAFGSYQIEDCHTCSFYSDMEVAFRSFESALNTMHVEAPDMKSRYEPQESFISAWQGYPRRLPPLRDPLESVKIWSDAPALVRELTASCMMPPRYKDKLHAHYSSYGVPLSDYQCGSCEKCLVQAVLRNDQLDWPHSFAQSGSLDPTTSTSEVFKNTPMTSQTLSIVQCLLDQVRGDIDSFDVDLPFVLLAHSLLTELRDQSGHISLDQPYPAAYLEHARKRLGSLFTLPHWCHVHPSLETPLLPAGESHQYLWDFTYGGHLTPRRIHRSQEELAKQNKTLPAREPLVTFL